MDDLEIINKGEYLYLTYSGEFSVNAGQGLVGEMRDACLAHGCLKVLLDFRGMGGAMPIIDRFQIIESGVTQMKGTIPKMAFVGRADQMLPDNFVENVAANRMMSLRIFTDVDEAVAWLLV